jgi:hypothetical protein
VEGRRTVKISQLPWPYNYNQIGLPHHDKNLRKIDESVPVHSTSFGSSSRRAEKHCLWQLMMVLATELFEIWLYNHSQTFCQQAHCTRPVCRLHPHDLSWKLPRCSTLSKDMVRLQNVMQPMHWTHCFSTGSTTPMDSHGNQFARAATNTVLMSAASTGW